MHKSGKRRKDFGKKKIYAGAITSLIILLLVLSGPAQALTLALGNFDNTSPVKGESITATASLDIKTNERIDIDRIDVYVDGIAYCYFNLDGDGDCKSKGIALSLLSSNSEHGYGYGYRQGEGYDYGYGYGYSNSKFSYSLVLSTNFFDYKAYKIKLGTEVKGKQYFSQETAFTVIKQNSGPEPRISGRSSGRCETTWECSAWSNCANNIQTRTCEKKDFRCDVTELEPEMEQSCVSLESNQDNSEINAENTQASRGAGITGAVVGAGESIGGIGIGIIVMVILLLLLTALLINYRRIRRKRVI